MGLNNVQKSLLNSKEVRNEMLSSLVLSELLPRLYFLTYEDHQLIESKVTDGNKTILLSHLLEKRLSSLGEFIDVLLEWGASYTKLIKLLIGKNITPKRRCRYVAENKDNGLWWSWNGQSLHTLIDELVEKKGPIYALAPYVYIVQDGIHEAIIAADVPELEKYEFPQKTFSEVNASVLLSDENILRFFLSHVAPKLPVIQGGAQSYIYVSLSDFSQSELHLFGLEMPAVEEPKPIAMLIIQLKESESTKALYLAPIVRLVSSHFVFSTVIVRSAAPFVDLKEEIPKEKKRIIADAPEILKNKNFIKHIKNIWFSNVELRSENNLNFEACFKPYFGTLQCFGALERLLFNGVEIQPEIFSGIIDAVKMSTVKEIAFISVKCLQYSEVIDRLSDALMFNKGIEKLSLKGNGLNEEQLAPLLDALSTTNLKQIDLDGNDVSEETKLSIRMKTLSS